jgi:glucose/arabinose dehydrogenase
MTLALRRAAPDDYDVIQAGEIAGRIYRMKADRELWRWMIPGLRKPPRVMLFRDLPLSDKFIEFLTITVYRFTILSGGEVVENSRQAAAFSHSWHATLWLVRIATLGILHDVCCRRPVLHSSQIAIWLVGSCSPLEGDGRRARRLTQPDPQGSGFFVVRFFCRTISAEFGRTEFRLRGPPTCSTLNHGKNRVPPRLVAAAKREESMNRSSRPGLAHMTGAAACLVLTAVPLLAQQGGKRVIGGAPNADIAARIGGAPQLPNPASEDPLPIKELKLPQGFKVETYISGIADARSLRIGDKGTVFVGNRQQDKVYAVIERGGKREAIVIASALDRPNGLAFKDGTLYVAEGTKISKLENIEDKLDNPPKPVAIYSDFPDHRTHGWKFLGLGPDNKLYVNVGAPCDICEPPAATAQIRRLNLDGSGAEPYALGVRNSVGFDFHPITKEFYFTDNGHDSLSEELPNDELNRVTKPGQHFGFPYCHQGDIPDNEFGHGRSCRQFVPPIAKLGPHAAALGMRFYTGTMFPAKYRGGIFIARHGSWNKSDKIGGDVIYVTLNRDGNVRSWEPFMTGFLKANAYVGRPVDVQPMRDGSLLVSDDYAGAVYRIIYGSNTASK